MYYGPTYQTFSSECNGNFVFSYNIYAEGLDTTELWNNSPIQISSVSSPLPVSPVYLCCAALR